MVALAGYEDFRQIYESANSRVYRARRTCDTATATLRERQSVILKFLNTDYPTPEQIRRYKQEYSLTFNLDAPGIIKAYSLEEWERSYAIALEDFGGISLKQWLEQEKRIEVREFLPWAIAIAESLAQIHAQNIIHKDINPANIVLNPDTRELKIIDFGIATQLNRETPTLQNPNVLEGTLPYISPEQTGRMNRGLDYRTDFYSLGVTFYEMLAGQLPFTSSDPLELVHCHIAKTPIFTINEEGCRDKTNPIALNNASSLSHGKKERERTQQELIVARDALQGFSNSASLTILDDEVKALRANEGKFLQNPEARVPPSSPVAIPPPIAEIVMKLMAKNAEDRYQNVDGLKADLEYCRQQLAETGKIQRFSLGDRDISDRFQIPQKLYGREAEIAQLLATFEGVANPQETRRTQGGELILVAGYSGIGKSALVQELYKPITARRGYFIAGKFDQFQRNIPYSAIVAAFRGLVTQLLGETESQLQIWRQKLLAALGNNGQIVIDVIPEVELIIGKQPTVPNLGANESQNRFNLVFGNFIRAFCSTEHPLAIFLDDLQWSDLATLKLMERLIEDSQTQYLLILGAYRDNEVSSGHPLTVTLERLRQKERAIAQITLDTLNLAEIAQLIGETLQSPPEAVRDLAELVLRKTEGNPFFINEFLQELHGENLLTFHRPSRCWQWDLEAIKAMGFTDNVVELMVGKLQKLPELTQQILSLAACLGAEFELGTLALISPTSRDRSREKIFQDLKIALDRGFLVPLSPLDENLLIQAYKFSHDRIQQAAYSLIPETERPAINLTIGRLLFANLNESDREEKLFDLVDRLNRGRALISEAEECENLARLNLQAGQKANTTAAYETAIAYLETGIQLLSPDCWNRQYELAFALHREAVKASYFNADIEGMEKLAAIAMQQAKTPHDRVKIGEIKLDAYTNQNRVVEALNVGLEMLSALGIEFPPEVSRGDFAPGLATIKALLGDRQPEDLLHLPRMEDPLAREALPLLIKILPVTYFAAPALFPLTVFKQIELSITYGNTSATAFGYATYGMILCGVVGEFDLGYEYGQLALNILSAFSDREFEAAVFMIVYRFVSHWKVHLRDALEPLQHGLAVGLETGDFSYSGYCNQGYCLRLFLTGIELSEAEREIQSHSEMLARIGQQTALNYNRPYWQAVVNLQGRSPQPDRLTGTVMDEDKLIAYYQERKNGSGLWGIYVTQLILAYWFGNYERGAIASEAAGQYLAAATSHALIPVWRFYDSLNRLAEIATGGDREEHWPIVTANQDYLKRCAELAPMNYGHKYDLVEAERYRILRDRAHAIESYDRAIAQAREQEYLQEEALANELAAQFYLDWDKEKIARAYASEAYYCYDRWGAIAKVQHLEGKYPQLLSLGARQTSRSDPIASNFFATRTTCRGNQSENLDLATVMKSTSAISSEIVLDKLLAAFMNILVENAGAQRGILLLPSPQKNHAGGNPLFVEAIKEANSEKVIISRSHSEAGDPLLLDDFKMISCKIVYYVARTQKIVVSNNAEVEKQFADDPYLQQYQCRSIACAPLINQGKLQGIIYLENNLTTGAFTQERLQLLQMLAAQAAVSLENARLYENLKTLNVAYERFVPSQFLGFLEKESIVDVKLGDQVEREMTVLFSDIRDFTSMSERMTPADNFAFINEYLGYMEPQIQAHGGFIDKYIGDAIMALFPDSADSALQGAIAMLEALKKYNQIRQDRKLKPLRIGIGLHTGLLTLGTVGGFGRMDGTAIGDAVNLSSRVEELTKTYGVSLLITHRTFAYLNNPFEYDVRFIEQVKAKGKAKAVGLFEVFSADLPEVHQAKRESKDKFEKAVILFHQKAFPQAARLFKECLQYSSRDRVARNYLERCHHYISQWVRKTGQE